MIREKQPKSEIVIDLSGPEGNAFVLMGYARQYAKQLGLDGKAIVSEMMEVFENLLEVFDRHFGDYVILER